jgi:uncharacterized protein
MLRLTARGILDALGGLVGRDPLLVPLVGPRGSVAMLSTPDALRGGEALNPGNRYPDWRQEIAARSALRVTFYRPARAASHIGCPLLVLAYDQDDVTPPALAVRAGRRAPNAEIVRRPGGHYAAFLGGHEEAVELDLSFLRRHLLDAE